MFEYEEKEEREYYGYKYKATIDEQNSLTEHLHTKDTWVSLEVCEAKMKLYERSGNVAALEEQTRRSIELYTKAFHDVKRWCLTNLVK